MVKNIIAIGKNFEMKVLAEGVETQRQRDQLEACGCDLIQGYFYSKPLSFDQLVSFVKDNKEEKSHHRLTMALVMSVLDHDFRLFLHFLVHHLNKLAFRVARQFPSKNAT